VQHFARQKEIVMGNRFSGLIVTAAIAGIAGAAVSVSVTRTSAQAPASKTTPLKTAWGESDLQGIWTDEFDTPLQRPSKYANQEFFTEAQRADFDKERTAILTRFATEREINGAYRSPGRNVSHERVARVIANGERRQHDDDALNER